MSSEIRTFDSYENISLLWEVLLENNIIQINNMEKVRPIFEQVVQKFVGSNNTSDIVQMNCGFLTTFKGVLDQLQNKLDDTPSQRRISDFESKLADAQNNFNQFNARAAPPPITFTTKVDDLPPVNINIDTIMSERGYMTGNSNPNPNPNSNQNINPTSSISVPQPSSGGGETSLMDLV